MWTDCRQKAHRFTELGHMRDRRVIKKTTTENWERCGNDRETEKRVNRGNQKHEEAAGKQEEEN